MKHTGLRSFAALFALFLLQTAVRGQARPELDTLLARLSGESLDDAVLWKLEAQPADPRTIPSLQAAFEKRTAKRERQAIAASLLRLGDKSDRYFEFLAGYAKQAVEDRTPLWEKLDAQGRWIRGEFSAEFENWCAQNHKEPREVAAIQFGVYLEDVKILAEVEDPRAIDLFRRGLDSPNPVVVAYSAQGLARLQDLSAIPLISKAADRMPPGDRNLVATQLLWYFRPEAEQLFERLIPDASYRDHSRTNVQMMKATELNRVRSRTGGAKMK